MVAKLDGTSGLLQQYDYQAPTTGFSYTFAAGTTVLVMNPAGTLATGTVTMPAAPADGMTISFSSTQNITTLTVNANSGQSIVGRPATLVAGGAATFVYRLSNTTWYAQTNTAALGSASPTNGFTNMVVLTSTNASYSIPATKIKVTVIGSGGGGAGGGNGSGDGGGGAGGGAAVQILSGLTIGNTLNVTVGIFAGGNAAVNNDGSSGPASSVASGSQIISTISATGGTGGGRNGGGTGGLGSGGILNIGGNGGGSGGDSGSCRVAFGGVGGSSILGGGGYAGGSGGGGGNGRTYGGGGGGASGNTTGGAGASGCVIIEY